MVSTLDPRESVATLVDLVVRRLCDWAVVTVFGEDRAPADAGRAHRDPDRLADLDLYLRRRVRSAADENPMVTALLTGEPIHLPARDPAVVEPALGGDEEVRAAWERLDAGSITVVSLRRGRRPSARSAWSTAWPGRRAARWRSPRRSRWPAVLAGHRPRPALRSVARRRRDGPAQPAHHTRSGPLTRACSARRTLATAIGVARATEEWSVAGGGPMSEATDGGC